LVDLLVALLVGGLVG